MIQQAFRSIMDPGHESAEAAAKRMQIFLIEKLTITIIIFKSSYFHSENWINSIIFDGTMQEIDE